MGNYDDHTRYGHAAYVLLGVSIAGAVASGGLPLIVGLPLAVLSYPFVRLGAAFPDIDHHASKPHHGLRRAMFVVGTIGSFFVLYTQSLVPLDAVVEFVEVGIGSDAKVALLVHLVALGFGAGLRESVSYFRPKHRGITHRVPSGLTVSGVIGGATWYAATTLALGVALTAATVIGGSFFLGFLSHLRCDRMLIPAVRGAVGSVGRALGRVRQSRPLSALR